MGEARGTGPGGSPAHALVLVADDNRMNRLLAAHAVEALGHRVIFAENGQEALAQAARFDVDVLLLDVVMPELDGYGVLAEMAKDRRLRSVPVIVVSSVEDGDGAIRCIEMGAEDYLAKPLNPVLLRARLNACLEKKRFRDWQRSMIERLTSDAVAEELESDGFALGGRAVRASVMFCDIRSFTPLAERLSPHDTIALLNEYYALMMDAITGARGIVSQLIGDGIMAVFGAPSPSADHESQAVRAALQMVEMMGEYSAQRVHASLPPVAIGIGIATGPMVAGFAGTQRRAVYTCIGDTVNLAARLESYTKDAGASIVIDDDTFRAAGVDGFRDGGEVSLKGKSGTVHVHTWATQS